MMVELFGSLVVGQVRVWFVVRYGRGRCEVWRNETNEALWPLVDEGIVFLGFSENDLSSTSILQPPRLRRASRQSSRLSPGDFYHSDQRQKGKKRKPLHSIFDNNNNFQLTTMRLLDPVMFISAY
jgi:hypothetical protein